MFKKKELSAAQIEAVETKDFFDRIVPGMLRFYTDHYICGNFYKSCWAVTGVSSQHRRNRYFGAFSGQKRCDLTHLQPPCDEHGAEKDCSAGNEKKSYDDHHQRC